MTTTQSWTEQFVEVAGSKLQVLKGGTGPPLLVLHGARGNPGWMPYHEALAQRFNGVRTLTPRLRPIRATSLGQQND